MPRREAKTPARYRADHDDAPTPASRSGSTKKTPTQSKRARLAAVAAARVERSSPARSPLPSPPCDLTATTGSTMPDADVAAATASWLADMARVDERRRARGLTCRRGGAVTYAFAPPSDPCAVVMKPWEAQQQDEADRLTRRVREQCEDRGLTLEVGMAHGSREFRGVCKTRAFGHGASVARGTVGTDWRQHNLGTFATAEIAAAHVADFSQKNPSKKVDLWTEGMDDALQAAYARLTVEPATMPHATAAQPAALRAAALRPSASTDMRLPPFQFSRVAPAVLTAPLVSTGLGEGEEPEMDVLTDSRARAFASISDCRASAFAEIAAGCPALHWLWGQGGRLSLSAGARVQERFDSRAGSARRWSADDLSRLDWLVAAHEGKPIPCATLAEMFPGRVPSELAPSALADQRRNRLAAVRAPLAHPATQTAPLAHSTLKPTPCHLTTA